MLRVIVAVGVPGVGKSTVLSLASRKLEEKGYSVRVANFGDYMLDYLRKTGKVDVRDRIRALPLSSQIEAQEAAARAIRRDFESIAAEKTVGIVDTHAVIKTRLGFWPGLPQAVLRELRPNVIVVIEASPAEVVARQMRDLSRYRGDLSSLETVEEMLQLNRYYSIASSVISGAALRFIVSREGRAEEAAEEFTKTVEDI